MSSSSATSTLITLPPALEFGENPKVFASLYELNAEQNIIIDTSAVLTARRVRGTTSDFDGSGDDTEINIIDFSATSLSSDQISANKITSSSTPENETEDDPSGTTASSSSSTMMNRKDANSKLATRLLSEMGGRTVCFDRVHSGQARTTEIVESLLPYALSAGSSSANNSVLFVNNFGASESPFQQPYRGETSIVYQILANMHSWVRRRSFEMEATLVAWDSWGDAVDLFSTSNTHAAAPTNSSGSNSYVSSAQKQNNSSLNHLMTEPLKFTGMNRMFDDLCVTKIIQSSNEAMIQAKFHSGIASNNNNNNSSSSNLSSSSRFKTVADLCDTVDKKVASFRRQIVTTAFSKDSSALSNSNDYRYAICLRLDLVPSGVDSNDELSWGSFSIVECSGSMLCQARSSRRGISPSLLSCVKALSLPAEEPPLKLVSSHSSSSSSSSSTFDGATSSSSTSNLLFPLQSLSKLSNRPELSLACCLLNPSCTSRLALVLPVPQLSYGSSALFVQASVDALCVIARREWITFPENPPPRTCETPLHLFANSFERKHKELTQLRWMMRKHRSCRLHEELLKIEEKQDKKVRQFDRELAEKRMMSMTVGFGVGAGEEEEDEHDDNRDQNHHRNGSPSYNYSSSSDTTTIPAIDAWIIAMQRRLASLEEVEADQHKWHAWLEDYREWLLSLPATGATSGTVLVASTNDSSNQTKENVAGSSTKHAHQSGHQFHHQKVTMNWADRCELLERVVAQQQEEMKRIKRICLRDVENLREEVAMLRRAKK